MPKRGDHPRPGLVVTGPPGIGKTQLAAAYARSRVAAGWPVVWWAKADNEATLTADLADLAVAAGLVQPDDRLVVAAERALSWLATHPGPCLLVYDNVRDPGAVNRWAPSVGRVQVVVTTTRQALAAVGRPVRVEVFTPEESVTYLRERSGVKPTDAAGAEPAAGESLSKQAVTATVRRGAGLLKEVTPKKRGALRQRRRGCHIVEHVEAMWAAAVTARAFPVVDLVLTASLLDLRRWATTFLCWTGDDPLRAVGLAEVSLAEYDRAFSRQRHQDWLLLRHDVALAYRCAGRIEDAIETYRHALPVAERVWGQHDVQAFRWRNHLGQAYLEAGRPEEAIAWYQRNLSRQLAAMLVRRNLASAYFTAGQTEKALALAKQALADCRAVHGESHSTPGRSEVTFACTRRRRGGSCGCTPGGCSLAYGSGRARTESQPTARDAPMSWDQPSRDMPTSISRSPADSSTSLSRAPGGV